MRYEKSTNNEEHWLCLYETGYKAEAELYIYIHT